jgi:hypothetical protein
MLSHGTTKLVYRIQKSDRYIKNKKNIYKTIIYI